MSLLGITPTGGTLADQYLLANTTAGTPGAGIVGQTIQFHGTADLYNLAWRNQPGDIVFFCNYCDRQSCNNNQQCRIKRW